jgi:hypothetical protein
MHDRLAQSDLFLPVATIAEFVPLLFQQEFRNDTVPEMAFLALPCLDHGMNVLEGKVFFGKFFMAVQTLFPSKRPLLRP